MADAQAAYESGDVSAARADFAEAEAWDEGGANRVLLQMGGGALIGGLGGSNAVAGAFGGAAGAGQCSDQDRATGRTR